MIRRFVLNRHMDISGVSGTGVIAVGAQFPSGRCVLEWLPTPRNAGFYESIEAIIQTHGHGGATSIQWIDEGDAQESGQQLPYLSVS